LIAIPGFAVSTEFAEANGVVQPIPNPAHTKSAVFLHDIAQAYPKQVRKTVAIYGEGIPSIARNKDQVKATAAKAVPEMKFLPDITHALLGQDFSVIAQKVIDSGATAVAYVGEPISLSSLLFELKAKGWDGIAFADANDYDQKLFVKGNDAVDGALLRLAQHMYEEADDYPVVKQLRDTITSFGPPNPTIAALSVQSFSAGLLFAQSVKNCVETGSGEISRVCVLDAAKKIDSWDGGGLHATSSPGKNLPPSCSMIVVAKGGKFERFEPKSKTNDGGFHCDENLTVKIEGDLGQGNVDPTLPY
jgi:ABC-type branched-subunit amino acid transport system substrate-binding protein